MAAFDFPANPTEGQQFTPPGGPTFVWRTNAWTLLRAQGGAFVFIGPDPPASPGSGTLWWENDTGNTFIWYDDGNTAQWVQISGVGPGSPVWDGGVVHNDITLNKDNASFAFDTLTPAAWSHISFKEVGVTRWEITKNASHALEVSRWDASGNYVDSPLWIDGNNGAFVMQGAVVVNRPQPVLGLNRPAATLPAQIVSQINYADRWIVSLGTAEPEGTGNSGNNFEIAAYGNNGAYIRSPLKINRASGAAEFDGDLVVDGKGYFRALGLQSEGDVTIIKPAGSRAVLNLENSDTAQRSQINLRRNGKDLFQIRTGGDASADPYLYVVDDSLTERAAMSFVRATGRTVLLSGQMTFPATANPSADANTLDDYREGTWVPNMQGSGSTFAYSFRTGTYTKVGRKVTAFFNIKLAASGNTLGSGGVSIQGLPYASTSAITVVGPVEFWNSGAALYSMTVQLTAGQSQLVIQGMTAAAVNSMNNLTAAQAFHATNGTQIDGSVTYEVP